MKTVWTLIIIIAIICLSGCTGAVEIPQNTITPSPTAITIHGNATSTPTPYPDNTFILTASYYPPTSDQLDVKFTWTNIEANKIEAIAWFIDNRFYKSYYRISPDVYWREHYPSIDPINDKVIKDPFNFPASENNANGHSISAKVYGFNINNDGGQVWLGDTNDISLT